MDDLLAETCKTFLNFDTALFLPLMDLIYVLMCGKLFGVQLVRHLFVCEWYLLISIAMFYYIYPLGDSTSVVGVKANLDSWNSGLEIITAHAHYQIPSEILQFR